MGTSRGRDTILNVLILLHSDGFIEVYGEGVNVCMLNVPHADCMAGEVLAEELVDLSIPKRFAELHTKDKLIATENLRKVLPSDIMYIKEMKRTLRELSAIGGRTDVVDTAIG